MRVRPLDPAVRYFFLDAKVRLLRLLRADSEAGDLMPTLYEAARVSAQPEKNRLTAQRFDPARAGLGALAAPDHNLQHVHRLVQDGQLIEAERLLLAEPAPAETTGTLVLGACETGMVKRIGRDERTGFVRAGLLSGASAVLAARWEALDLVAARVLGQIRAQPPPLPARCRPVPGPARGRHSGPQL